MKPTCNVKDVAQALIAAADAKGAVEAVVHDVLTVTEAFESDPVLVVELQEPAVPIEKRRNALTAALKGSVHPVVVNALLILQASNALQVLHTFASRRGRHDRIAAREGGPDASRDGAAREVRRDDGTARIRGSRPHRRHDRPSRRLELRRQRPGRA
jgi:hypothetical protein